MRIVAGKFGSRVIDSVEGNSTRPTLDKVKGAIFSRIGPYFDGGCMLDLFAGSGNISFEAISRGMAKSYMCDSNYKAITTIKKNAKTLGLKDECVILKMDFKQALKHVASLDLKFDLIYLDPPYLKQEIDFILNFISTNNLLSDNGVVVCESLKEDSFLDNYADLIKVKEAIYGITKITYYERDELNECGNLSR